MRFDTSEKSVTAVHGLDFQVDAGEVLAIVGESGSGKSVTSLPLMRLVELGGGRIVSGSMKFTCRGGQTNDAAIMARHIFPGTISSIVVYFSMCIGTSIITAASRSFLGLGAQPPMLESGAPCSTRPGRTW